MAVGVSFVLPANFPVVPVSLAVRLTIPAVMPGVSDHALLTRTDAQKIPSFMGALMAIGVAVGGNDHLLVTRRATACRGQRAWEAAMTAQGAVCVDPDDQCRHAGGMVTMALAG